MGQKQLYDVTTGRSLCLFPLESKFRKMMIKFFLLGKYFDDVVLCFILANCILLAVNNPAEWSEYLFIGVFTFEGVAKVRNGKQNSRTASIHQLNLVGPSLPLEGRGGSYLYHS